MNITHDTTIDEYEAWLSTNPSFTDFKIAVRNTFKSIYSILSRIRNIVRKSPKKRSCLRPKVVGTVFPFCYDKNAGFVESLFKTWLEGIHQEREDTTLYLEALEFYGDPDDEIGQEMTLCEALEILNVKN